MFYPDTLSLGGITSIGRRCWGNVSPQRSLDKTLSTDLLYHVVIVMCATACFDIGYKVSDICDDEGDTVHEKCPRFLPPVSMSITDVWRGMTYC